LFWAVLHPSPTTLSLTAAATLPFAYCAHLCIAEQAHVLLFYLPHRAFHLLFNIRFFSHSYLEETTSFLVRNKHKLGTRTETTDCGRHREKEYYLPKRV